MGLNEYVDTIYRKTDGSRDPKIERLQRPRLAPREVTERLRQREGIEVVVKDGLEAFIAD